MRVVPIDEFVKYITPMAENCPALVARREVLSTVADICRATGCVTAETLFITHPHVAEYRIPVQEGLSVELVRSAYCDGHKLNDMRIDEMERRLNGNDWWGISGRPMCFTFRRPNDIRLIPFPEAEHAIRLDVVVSVEREAKQVPEQFFTDYLDTVVAGALSRIFRIAGQTYSNVQLAERNLLAYQQGLNDIHADAVRDFTRVTGRVQYNRIM